MSKIYEALIQAGRKGVARAAILRTHTNDNVSPVRILDLDSNFEWKLTVAVATVTLVCGLLLVIIANQFLGRALRTENDQRALAIATNLSDAAAGPAMEKNILELYALLTKYARLDGAAYAFIEDNNGQIVAHSMKPFPSELKQTLTPEPRKQITRRTVTLEGKTVYETSVPILEGQLGAAHFGMWADSVKTEISAAGLRLVGLLTLILVVAVSVAVFVVRAMLAPIRALSDTATETSAGELKAPLHRVAR